MFLFMKPHKQHPRGKCQPSGRTEDIPGPTPAETEMTAEEAEVVAIQETTYSYTDPQTQEKALHPTTEEEEAPHPSTTITTVKTNMSNSAQQPCKIKATT